jgi:predicted DNA-binding protein (UPF0251 family)
VPRPHKCRFIAANLAVSAFKPAGTPARDLESVQLRLDELEALRLADLEGLYQDAAAERMGISRPTFSRLIEGARHKVADALLNSRMLLFQGGNVAVAEMRTFECADCGARFQVPFGTGRPAECPECKSANIHRASDKRGGGHCRRRGAGGRRGGGQRQRQRQRGAPRGTATGGTPAQRAQDTPKQEDQE